MSKPHQRAGVAAVDRARRAGPRRPTPCTTSSSSATSSTSDAERAHRVDRRLRVAGAAEAVHVRLALAERAEQHGAVRDRLVAGHGDVPDEL